MPKSTQNPGNLQSSIKPSSSAGKPYTSGANVHKGGGPGPSKPAPASQPKGQTY